MRFPGIEHIPWLYDALMAVQEALGFRAWRRWLTGGAQGRILEVGCGTGRNLPLYPDPLEVIGLDPDLLSLRRARGRAAGTPLVCARAEALPFISDAFDTVISALVFCSVADPHLALLEVRRVLKPEGRLRMLEHVRADGELQARLQDAVQPFWTWLTGGCHPNRDTVASVEATGFMIGDRHVDGTFRRFAARPQPGDANRSSPLRTERTGRSDG